MLIVCNNSDINSSVTLNINEESTIANLLYYLNSIGFISFSTETQPFLQWKVYYNDIPVDYYSTIKELGISDNCSLIISYNNALEEKIDNERKKEVLTNSMVFPVGLSDNIYTTSKKRRENVSFLDIGDNCILQYILLPSNEILEFSKTYEIERCRLGTCKIEETPKKCISLKTNSDNSINIKNIGEKSLTFSITLNDLYSYSCIELKGAVDEYYPMSMTSFMYDNGFNGSTIVPYTNLMSEDKTITLTLRTGNQITIRAFSKIILLDYGEQFGIVAEESEIIWQ